ncbi:MAG: InlB B-repeat-containing protein [Acholeplasmatales bacterium]|jgi:hypothetical protein|nr:InlB B-repeat-containing protein [Acholeplasmatales bacterium]
MKKYSLILICFCLGIFLACTSSAKIKLSFILPWSDLSPIESRYVEANLPFNQKLPSINYPGYEFQGWYLDENYTNSLSENYTSASDLSLWAKLDLITYQVNYLYPQNSAAVFNNNNPDHFNIREVIIFNDPLVSSGFVFNGWFLDENYHQPVTQLAHLSTNQNIYGQVSVEGGGNIVPSIHLTLLEDNFYTGFAYQLSATITPLMISQSFTYSSSDEAIATVNSEGLITILSAGMVTISVSCLYQGTLVSATITISTQSGPITYQVIFHIGSQSFNQQVNNGSSVDVPNIEGVYVTNWYTDSALTNLYLGDFSITSDLELWAQYHNLSRFIVDFSACTYLDLIDSLWINYYLEGAETNSSQALQLLSGETKKFYTYIDESQRLLIRGYEVGFYQPSSLVTDKLSNWLNEDPGMGDIYLYFLDGPWVSTKFQITKDPTNQKILSFDGATLSGFLAYDLGVNLYFNGYLDTIHWTLSDGEGSGVEEIIYQLAFACELSITYASIYFHQFNVVKIAKESTPIYFDEFDLITIDTSYNLEGFVNGWNGNTWKATRANLVSEVGISVNALNVDYSVGDSFNASDIEVRILYSNATSTLLSYPSYQISGFNTATPGQKSVTISYATFSAVYDIYVSAVGVSLVSIEVDAAGAQVVFFQGEPYNSTNLILIGHYSDSSTSNISITAITNNSTDTLGVISVDVYHDSLSTSYNITIVEIYVEFNFSSVIHTTTSYGASLSFPTYSVPGTYVDGWYLDSLLTSPYSGNLDDITEILVLWPKILNSTKFVFDITITSSWVPVVSNYLVHYYGVDVNNGNGSGSYGADDNFLTLTISGLQAWVYLPVEHEGLVSGFEFLFTQNSQQKASNWLIFTASLNNTEVKPIFVNSWLGDTFLLTLAAENIWTIAIDGSFLNSWSPTVYWLRVVIYINQVAYTINLQGSGTEGSDNVVLATIYTFVLVAELNIDYLEIWFCQYEYGSHQHKGSIHIDPAIASGQTLSGTDNWSGNTWSPLWSNS